MYELDTFLTYKIIIFSGDQTGHNIPCMVSGAPTRNHVNSCEPKQPFCCNVTVLTTPLVIYKSLFTVKKNIFFILILFSYLCILWQSYSHACTPKNSTGLFWCFGAKWYDYFYPLGVIIEMQQNAAWFVSPNVNITVYQ